MMIAGGNATSDEWLMSRPDIKTAELLKGGSAAIALFGGLGDFMTRIALKRLGLTPIKDVALLQIGGNPERLGALETGKILATMLPQPDNFVAQKMGFYNLVSVRLPYQSTGAATTRRFIQESPDIVRRYIKSQIEAIHRIRTDREAAIKVLGKYQALDDKEILERTYDDISTDDRLPPQTISHAGGAQEYSRAASADGPQGKGCQA